VEFIVSIIIGILLLCAATTIMVVSFISMVEGITYDPGILAVWAACIAIITCEIMFRHGICIGKQMDSPAMIANAWEKRSDAYSSLAALVGIFGTRLGFSFSDPAAAIVVGFMIARSGTNTLILGIKGITDRSFDDNNMLVSIKKLLLKESGIKNIGRLRARQIGQKNWVDIEAKYDPKMKVCEVTRINSGVKKKIMDEFGSIGDLVIVSRASEPELKEI